MRTTTYCLDCVKLTTDSKCTAVMVMRTGFVVIGNKSYNTSICKEVTDNEDVRNSTGR